MTNFQVKMWLFFVCVAYNGNLFGADEESQKLEPDSFQKFAKRCLKYYQGRPQDQSDDYKKVLKTAFEKACAYLEARNDPNSKRTVEESPVKLWGDFEQAALSAIKKAMEGLSVILRFNKTWPGYEYAFEYQLEAENRSNIWLGALTAYEQVAEAVETLSGGNEEQRVVCWINAWKDFCKKHNRYFNNNPELKVVILVYLFRKCLENEGFMQDTLLMHSVYYEQERQFFLKLQKRFMVPVKVLGYYYLFKGSYYSLKDNCLWLKNKAISLKKRFSRPKQI